MKCTKHFRIDKEEFASRFLKFLVSKYLGVHLENLTFRALNIKSLVMKRSIAVAVVEVPLITLLG